MSIIKQGEEEKFIPSFSVQRNYKYEVSAMLLVFLEI